MCTPSPDGCECECGCVFVVRGLCCLSVRLTFWRVLWPGPGPGPNPTTPIHASKCILRCTNLRLASSSTSAIKHLYECRDISDKISLLIKQIKVGKDNN